MLVCPCAFDLGRRWFDLSSAQSREWRSGGGGVGGGRDCGSKTAARRRRRVTGLKPILKSATIRAGRREGEGKKNSEEEEKEVVRRRRENLISSESVGYKDARCDH